MSAEACRYVERPVVTCSECMTAFSISEARQLAEIERVKREDGSTKGIRLHCDVRGCDGVIFYAGDPHEDDPLAELVSLEQYAARWPGSPRIHDPIVVEESWRPWARWALALAVMAAVAVLVGMAAAWLGWW